VRDGYEMGSHKETELLTFYNFTTQRRLNSVMQCNEPLFAGNNEMKRVFRFRFSKAWLGLDDEERQ